MKKNILCVIGTRPEAIKMAPVIMELKKSSWAHCRIVSTGQHREMLEQMLTHFKLKPDINFDLMTKNQSLAELTGRIPAPLEALFSSEKPDLVLAQGDTTTVFAVSLVCFYKKIPFAHLEAGLRSHNMQSPFPEEMNRVLISNLTQLHFAPTEKAKTNLCNELVPDNQIYVTGNTVIDALMYVANQDFPLPHNIPSEQRLILVTAHRRENFGENLIQICNAIIWLVRNNLDIHVLYPVHPNPNVANTVHSLLSNEPRVTLCNPLNYIEFVSAMKNAYFILSDSGGVQEEAPALSKPVLVLRTETERPEAIELGLSRIVAPTFENITREAQELLDNPQQYNKMAQGLSPYGDGKSANRIVSIMHSFLEH